MQVKQKAKGEYNIMLNVIIYSKDTEHCGILFNMVAADFKEYNPYGNKTWKTIKGVANFAKKNNINIVSGNELINYYKKIKANCPYYKLHEDYIENTKPWYDR